MLILKKRQKTSFYGECKKNHAAHLGSHAVDGCGEYIPLASANLSDPASLMCAACGCHRNFHHLSYRSDNYGLTDEAEEEATASDVLKSSRDVVKRLRSNFSKEQKEAMVELAKKIGWSLKGREEGLVEEVCMRIGVEREVFRSWVHNHKKSFLASKSEMITNNYAVAINVDGDGDDDGDKEQ